MKKEFIPYEEALALKELGFDEPCLDFYDNNEELFYNHENKEKIHIGDSVKAPLYQQAFRWFREKYGLTWEHQFDDGNISLYVGVITYPDNALNFFKTIEVEYDGYNKAYEETELECLKKLIEIVNNK